MDKDDSEPKDEENQSASSSKRMSLDLIYDVDNFILEKIKKYYHLITLSSFSLLLATFSQKTVPDAFSYAVSSSIFFMFAFLVQFYKEFISEGSWLASGFSFFSSVIALINMVLVIREYSLVVETIPKTFSYINIILVSLIIMAIPFEFLKSFYPSYKYIKTHWHDNTELVQYAFCVFSLWIYNLFWMILFLISVISSIFIMPENELVLNNAILNIIFEKYASFEYLFISTIALVFGMVFQIIAFQKLLNTSPFKIMKEIKKHL